MKPVQQQQPSSASIVSQPPVQKVPVQKVPASNPFSVNSQVNKNGSTTAAVSACGTW